MEIVQIEEPTCRQHVVWGGEGPGDSSCVWPRAPAGLQANERPVAQDQAEIAPGFKVWARAMMAGPAITLRRERATRDGGCSHQGAAGCPQVA
ncbi:hypothetical protein HaLaN_14992 [Haematococcus lacustris]|uniref:Uncharacterized protein n=1 Tax=Haematococcus lacustris TaxID=44745 RepID=A0A699ZGP0_HAELA|nr:hypothetical protein HaLaN_14992 [Haematococcus lacustris]